MWPFAKERLTAMKRPIPQADPAAYNREKYEAENATHPGFLHRSLGVFESRPDTSLAAKSGAPAMQAMRPAVPVSVPDIAAGRQSGVSDVGVTQVGDNSAIDQKPDARLGTPAAPAPTPAAAATRPTVAGSNGAPRIPGTDTTNAQTTQALPTNHPLTADQLKAFKKEQIRLFKQAKKNAIAAQKATGKSGTTPAASTTPGAPAAAPGTTTGTTPGTASGTTPGSPQ